MTPELAAQIETLVADGNYLEVAAKAADVSPRTVQVWLAKGQGESEGPHHDFRRAILRAIAVAETKHVATIVAAAMKDPKWAAWYLSHKHPERWSESREDVNKMKKEMEQFKKEMGLD